MKLKASPGPVAVGDKLDAYSAFDLLAVVQEAARGSGELTIDLGASENLHAAALQVLVSAARHCDESQRPFRLIGLSPQVLGMLRLTGLDRALRIEESTPVGGEE